MSSLATPSRYYLLALSISALLHPSVASPGAWHKNQLVVKQSHGLMDVTTSKRRPLPSNTSSTSRRDNLLTERDEQPFNSASSFNSAFGILIRYSILLMPDVSWKGDGLDKDGVK